MMSIFWGMLGLINLFWGYCFFRSKTLTEKELVAISPKFKGIDSHYISFSIFWIFFVFLIPLWTIASPIDNWSLMNYGRRFYPEIIFFTSLYTIYQDLFAIARGVYPQGKMLWYGYSDERLVRQVAKRQIISSIVLLVASVLFFFITSSGNR